MTWTTGIAEARAKLFSGWRRVYWLPLEMKYRSLFRGVTTAIYYGHSLGDNLLLSAVAREWARQKPRALAVLTPYVELFDNNPYLKRVCPLNWGHLHILARTGVRAIRCDYDMEPRPGWPQDYRPRGTRHILAEMMVRCGLTGKVELLPRIYLGDETEGYRPPPPYLVLHSTSMRAGFMPYNKEWGVENWRRLVGRLEKIIPTVQVGFPEDPPLAATMDLRGRTTLRETAALIRRSHGVVCHEGFLMHLARAVDRRSVVIYGGTQFPGHTGYQSNENIFSSPECAPCFRLLECPEKDRRCLSMISVDMVLERVLRMLERHGEELSVDIATLDAPEINLGHPAG